MTITLVRPLVILFAGLILVGCSSALVTNATWTEPDGFQVETTEYTQKNSNGKVPDTVIILPPTGGTTYIEKQYAGRLAERGKRAIILNTWSGLNDTASDLDIHNRLFAKANRAVGMALTRATGEVGLIGTSLGGLYGLSALSRYPQIKRAVLIVAGYKLTDVIGRSQYPSMLELRAKRDKIYHFPSNDAYVAKLDTIFNWNDPDTIRSPELDRVKLLLFQGTEDKVVPTSTQENLAQRVSSARVIKLNDSHFWTIVYTYLFHEDEVLDHISP